MNFHRVLVADANVTLTAAECARRTGLTVKALRVYEREGLLRPKRTMKDWRIYDAADLARLGEVMALRALGLKLADIRTLLKGKSGDIGRMLEWQQEDLLARRGQIEAALALVADLRRGAAVGEALTLNDLTTAIKETQMTAPTADAISWKRYEQMRPRTAIAADARNMAECAGHFRLEGGSVFHIYEERGKFMAKLATQDVLEIFPEAKDRYFYTGVPAQLVFEREGDEVVAVVLHQNGVESRAPRISSVAADASAAALTERIKANQPLARSAEVMEAILRGQMAGTTRFDLMHDALAAAAVEQGERITKELRELGALKSFTFVAVTPEGWDFYRAAFERGELDCGISLGEDGRAEGALLEAPKAESFWRQLREKVLG